MSTLPHFTCTCTRTHNIVKEARLKEIRTEILNSKRLQVLPVYLLGLFSPHSPEYFVNYQIFTNRININLCEYCAIPENVVVFFILESNL